VSFVTFLGVACAVLAGLHYYIWARLVRDTRLPAPWRTGALLILIVLGAGLPSMIVLTRRFPAAAHLLAWPLYTWLGTTLLLFVLLAGADILKLLGRAWRWAASSGESVDWGRRTLIARGLGGAVTTGAAALTAVAVRSATGPVTVQRVPVILSRLPRALDGLTIVQLTDMHVGPTIGRAFVEEIVGKTNALSPDIIAITGDLVDGPVSSLRDATAPLANLRARHGVFFVTGNHEYYSGAPAWIAELTRLGIRCLRNERVSIGADESSFDLAGVDDRSGARFGHEGHGEDLPKALGGRDPARELVLLAHQPRSAFDAERFGVGLQLSGHTHGGQLWPFNFVIRLQQPFVAGLHRHGRAQIYVSRGAGYWGPPMRLGAPPEITEIVLRSNASG
jgi:predicted MPP superfamily phosphohydrolase